MPRIQLFELEDQAWFPAVIRDAGTAFLRVMVQLSGQSRLFAPKLRELLERSGERHIVDLCSGGAGPLPIMLKELKAQGIDVTATLTDLYPNVAGFEHLCEGSEGRLDFVGEPVDVGHVPDSLRGLRTLFNALHHFRPAAARSILQSAVDAGQPIGVFEAVSRHPVQLLGMLFVGMLVMLCVPFLRPFRWSWLWLTYVIPVIPLFAMWDGMVSCLRVYSKRELHELVAGLEGGERFEWEIGTIALSPSPAAATYLIGTPRRATAARPAG
jgi:hypothetical protein